MAGCGSGLWLGQADTPQIPAFQGFLSFFLHPAFTWLCAGLILSLCVGTWAWFRFRLMKEISLSLARAKGHLNLLHSPEEFTAKSDALYRDLKGNSIVGGEWKTFCDQLVPPSGPGVPIRRTKEAEYYFNEHLLNRAGINLRLFNAFSGYLLGLGLLCTFFGLVMALYVTSMAINESPEKLVVILQSLLMAASFKFVNSIAGLGCSMFFSWQVRETVHRFQMQLDGFCRAVNDLVPYASSEMLLAEGEASRREQTEVLRRLPSELATALDSKLSSNLIRLVDPIAAKIEGVTERIVHLSQDAVQSMVREFRAQLVGAAAEEISELLRGLETARKSIESMGEQIAGAAKNFEGEMASAARHVFERMGEGAGRVEESFRNTARQLETSLQPLASQILTLNESFLKMDEKMKGHLDLFTESMETLRAVLGDFRATAEKLGQASAPLTLASQELFAMSKRIQEGNEATVQALGQLSAFSQSLSETAQQTRATWDVYRERFEKVDGDLKGMVDQLGNGFVRYHDMVDGFMRQLDQGLAKSTQALGAVISELNDTVNRLESKR